MILFSVHPLPNVRSFQDIALLPPNACSMVKFRIIKKPSGVRRLVAKSVANIEIQAGRPIRGYVQRTHVEYVEVVLVVEQTTEELLSQIFAAMCVCWKQLDRESYHFELINYSEASLLNEYKFQIVKANNEPTGFSVFMDYCDDDNFTVVSSLK